MSDALAQAQLKGSVLSTCGGGWAKLCCFIGLCDRCIFSSLVRGIAESRTGLSDAVQHAARVLLETGLSDIIPRKSRRPVSFLKWVAVASDPSGPQRLCQWPPLLGVLPALAVSEVTLSLLPKKNSQCFAAALTHRVWAPFHNVLASLRVTFSLPTFLLISYLFFIFKMGFFSPFKVVGDTLSVLCLWPVPVPDGCLCGHI